MGILDGKRILVTGVLTDASIAFHVARVAQEQGATVVLTAFRRPTLVERIAKRLPSPPPVIELDVTSTEQLDSLADRVKRARGRPRRRGALDRERAAERARRQLPRHRLGGRREGRARLDVRLKSLTMAALPLMPDGGSVVGLDFDASVAWPATTGWGWPRPGLSPAPATWPATSARGRSGSTSWRPGRSRRWRPSPYRASRSSRTSGRSARRSAGTTPTRRPRRAPACALLSDWFPATTGEIVHVDGGVHAVGI